ncbi:hypothetical protein P1P57_13715 [Enterococcus faecalis]|uniref:hypothetical protein n=1 Tax=Enterococcus faecalis TaxID=1351 RepID=UPI0025B210C8|nr:hypothetical protein [Enterococcus faecalis]MDN3136700.1 hypothetical protein [Enterococcus faecalis]
MRDFSLLDSAIDEMERVLLGNKPREAEEIYLQNAIDFIERFIKQLIEESKLNENQQIVLDWLKTLPLFPISAVYLLEVGKNVPNNVKNAYENFDKKEEAEVLQAFSLWAFEQEEK